MYIKKEINIVITDEEKEILNKARKILMNFEDESSIADLKALQEKYSKFIDGDDPRTALPTAIDLLTTILGVNDL